MLRPAGVLLALLFASATPAAAATKHRTDGKLADWRGEASNIAGRTVISKGELITSDFVYDDHGPDLDGRPNMLECRCEGAPARGDYRYPGDPTRHGYNAADLREVRVALTRRGAYFLVSLQTLLEADQAIVLIGIDGDASDATSAGAWPLGAGIATRGPERFIATWGSGSALIGPDGATAPLKTAVNLEENAIELQVSRRALGRLGGKTRIWAVAGVNDGGRFQEIEAGRTAVFNSAFRAEGYPRLDGSWSENEQSRALAGQSVSPFHTTFSPRRLERGRSDRRRPLEPGFHVRLHRSKDDWGEGIELKQADGSGSLQGEPQAQFRSRWQPYALHVPKDYDHSKAAPLTIDGHSLSVNHLEYRVVSPRRYEQLGDERGAIVITPLARGIDTWYLEAGLVDVMEAWDDVRSLLNVDEDQTSLTGYSMGGYMTYRMGLLMPDRFSRASVYVGPPAYYFWPYPLPLQSNDRWRVPGNTNLIVENALNLPYEVVHGNADALVPVSGVQNQVDSFRASGNAFRFFRHSADDHFSFIASDEWARTRDWLGNFARDRNPPRVRYRRFPSMDLPERGLVFDRAYWASAIAVRDATAVGSSGLLDLTTRGRGGHRIALRDLGTSPVAGPTTPGTLTGQEQVAGEAISKRNGFEGTLENIGSVTLDLARMGLDASEPIAIAVESDGPARLVLEGPSGRERVVELRAGKNEMRITPGG